MMPDKADAVLEEVGRDRETPIFMITAYGSVGRGRRAQARRQRQRSTARDNESC
jgi:hypothetical protein